MVKLEVGKFYRTRAGYKAGPLEKSGSDFYPFCTESETYTYDGMVLKGKMRPSDLIAEWTDTPAEVIGANVRVIPINEAPYEVFERMAETRGRPYDDPSAYSEIIEKVNIAEAAFNSMIDQVEEDGRKVFTSEMERAIKSAEISPNEYGRAPLSAPRSKYHRIIKGVEVDIYDILVAWGVTCPARQHAIKKMLMAGERGAKGVVQDLDEAIQATERAKELVG